MRVIAVLEIDKEKLAETGHSFEEEMRCLAQSGITLKEYKENSKCSRYEYAAFAWNTKKQEYEQIGRKVESEQLCINRYNEYVDNEMLPLYYDTNRVVFRKRLVSGLYAKWEDIANDS